MPPAFNCKKYYSNYLNLLNTQISLLRFTTGFCESALLPHNDNALYDYSP